MEDQKHLFNIRDGVHYLNCAYKAPMLRSAEEAAIRSLVTQRNPADIKPIDFYTEVEQVRSLFASLVNCTASQVAVMPSTSYGFSSVLNNITARKGQHAITIENEFPSDYFAIENWCKEHDAELIIIRPDQNKSLIAEDWNNRIMESINENTAIVILSSIHWMNGVKFDLESIGKKCRETDTVFIVDGTQSVGALQMDVAKFNIDALICATYKWLLGPYSITLAFIGQRFNEGRPLEESWMNRVNAHDFSDLTKYETNYFPDAGRYNVGQASNFILMPMLLESLNQILRWDVNEIQNYAYKLIQPLINYMQNQEIVFENEHFFSNHLFGLKLPKGVELPALKENLTKNNIYLSPRGNSLRLSVHVFNTSHDIEKLIEVLEETRI